MSDHRVICSDCLDPVTGLATLPDKSVDHVITDPPYEAEAHSLLVRRAEGPGHGKSVPVLAPLPFDAISADVRQRVAIEMVRVARRWLIVFCQAEAVGAWRDALVAGGASYRRACVWVKPDGMPQMSGDRPGMGYESIVCAHVSGRSRWNGGGKCGVYEVLRFQDAERNPHPTTKPVKLMEALVRDFTDAGETILDPFAGSGTTGVAAKRLGRRFLGWERDPKYHAIAEKRIAAAREQFSLFAKDRSKPKQAVLISEEP